MDTRATQQQKSGDLPYWVALVGCLRLGPTRFALLRRAFPSMAEAWSANARALAAAGLDQGTVRALEEHRHATDVDKAWQQLERHNLKAVTVVDDQYPKLLKEIFDPPPVLFYRGNLDCLRASCLAVVGTRQATSYGSKACQDIIGAVAGAGVTIVSGLAYGIDAAAHRAALTSKGKTVAVLANGLDTVYPTAHQHLAEEITSSGAIVSEFPPGVPALKQHFPQRNRTIAGLARATLVIEAAEGSGALITARYALESNREVMAVPGSIFVPQSYGPNQLLRDGAHLVTSAEDVLALLGLEAAPVVPMEPPSQTAAVLLSHLSGEPRHVDELARAANLSVAELMAQLTTLELSGHVREVGGKRYQRVG